MKRGLLLLLVAGSLAQAQVIPVRASLDSTGSGKSSTGAGTLIGTYDVTTKSLTYQIVVNGLQGTVSAQHFHVQIAGGPVVQAIPAFTNGVTSGTWSGVPDSLLRYLFMEQIYVNVHTSYNAGGEIRGIVKVNQFSLQASLSANAGVSTTGKGVATISFDSTNVGKLNYHMSVTGLTSAITAAHFHVLPGGSVIYPLTFSNGTAGGDWRGFPDSVLTLMLHGKVYVNVHTSNFPGGEISGTLLPAGELVATGTMDGPQAGTVSTGKGTVYAILSPNGSNISYQATYSALQGTLSAAHFHTAVGGGVVKGVTFGSSNTTFGDWSAPSDVNVQDFLKGRLYFNVHSSVNAGGEIRANMDFEDGSFTANLESRQAGVTSSALGTAWIKFVSDSVLYSAAWANLSGSFSASHFHQSSNGAVIFPLTVTNSATAGTWNAITESQMTALVTGGVYINVHTSSSPGGEIRGNFRIGSGATQTSVTTQSADVPAGFSLGQNFPNPFNPSTTIQFDLPVRSDVVLHVFDMLGREVATLAAGIKEAGRHDISFHAGTLASGVYLYRVTASNFIVGTRTMILVR